MVIFDGHCDSVSCSLSTEHSLNKPVIGRQFDFAQALGVTNVQVMGLFMDITPRETIHYGDFLFLRRRLQVAIEQNKQVTWITNRTGLLGLSEDQLGVLMAIEGGEVIGNEPARFEDLYDAGVRALTLTWNNDNCLAGGVLGEKPGLTQLGRRGVKIMNDLGMVVDVAHLAPQGLSEVLSISNQPIMASHANCAALFNHPRNLSDAQIKAIDQAGGVIGLTYVPEFLREPFHEASIDDLVDHIAHIAYLVGTKCPGLGSDFDGITHPLPGLEGVHAVPNLVEKLSDKGFLAKEIEEIMGGNMMRVFSQVLKA